MKAPEDIDAALNPHRAAERAAANMEVAGHLEPRGIIVTGKEDSEELTDLLTAVERFEEAEQHGGDLMVDDLRSSSRTTRIS